MIPRLSGSLVDVNHLKQSATAMRIDLALKADSYVVENRMY
jgi:hypothetical protein